MQSVAGRHPLSRNLLVTELSNTPVPSPGDFIKKEMEARGWTQRDLARVLDRPLPTVNEIIQGKRAVMPEMAIELGMAFGTGAEIWVQREAMYRLSLADRPQDDAVVRRAKMLALAPIKEMEKRQWIQPTDNAAALEAELRQFFGTDDLESIPSLGANARKTDHNEPLSPSQNAWCFRVRQLAKMQLVGEFDFAAMSKHEAQLRKIAAFPQESHKIVNFLASIGIRFVVVEPLLGAKVDGIAFWLNENEPVIGMSMRYDRVDSFWHTLCHEWSHIKNRDEAPLDSDLTDKMATVDTVKSPIERRADQDAANMLIPAAELESFINRVGPMYSKDRIGRFANRIKMHPGIIVGQLQHRGEIGFHANREMLVKIRHVVTPAAITDGWGFSIDPRKLK